LACAGFAYKPSTVGSWLAHAIHSPFGPQATAYTKSEWPVKIFGACGFARSQSRTVLSKLADARRLPSGEKATQATTSACPPNVAIRDQSLVLNSRMSPRADGWPPA